MQLTLIVEAGLAARLRGPAPDPVRAAISQARATLYPPPTTDTASAMARTFIIEVPDQAGEALGRALAALPGVQACYAKPADAAP